MNFYKHYIGDFQRDTGHLSLTERGAYLSLIHHYYATEKPLPNNIDALCRIAGAVSSIERKAVKSVLGFFEVVDSGLMHSRIEAEIQKAGEQANTNRDIALAREAKRRAEKEAKNNHEDSTKRADNVPRNEYENSTNHTPDTIPQLKPNEETHTVENNTSNAITPAGSVCVALKKLFDSANKSIVDMNQSDPSFIACIEAGASVDEFLHAGQLAIEKNKGFVYLVGIVIRQRQQAKNLNLHKGALPPSTSREAGRHIAANSIFTPENTQHLNGVQLKTINEVSNYEQPAITA